MFRKRNFLMLISLLIAIGLWMYVMGSVDPVVKETRTGVKVEMQGQDSLDELGLKATLNGPKMITITIEGKRSQINKLKDKEIRAYIDVSTCDYGKNTTEIMAKLPEGTYGINIEKMSDYEATFTVK